MLSKANMKVKWCLQLCMQEIQGGHPERSTHLFRCHLHNAAADGITAHSAALRKHKIFKLSALKDKLQVTQLPCWTHAHHPQCQASTAQLHQLQLRSKPWLLGESCFAGRLLQPIRSLLQKTVLRPFLFTAAAETVSRKGGAVFCVPAQLSEEMDVHQGWRNSHLPWWEGSITPQPAPALPAGLELRPTARPQQHQRARLNDALQPRPSSTAKPFSFPTSKCTSGYNTVRNGSLHSLRWIQRKSTYGY